VQNRQFPTTVENNCIASKSGGAGFFNGISAKGSWNNIVGNTIANTWADGALYMRDGDLNVWAYNQVTDNNNGFWTMSGRSNIFIRNFFNNNAAYGKVLGGKEKNESSTGKLLRTGHFGNFANGPDSTLGETSYHFPSTNTLFTQNHFWYTRASASQKVNYWNAAVPSRDAVVSRNRVKQDNGPQWWVNSLFAPIAPNSNGTLNVDTRWNSKNTEAYKDFFDRMTLRSIFMNFIDDDAVKPTKQWFGNFAVWPNWSNSGFQRSKTNGFDYYESQGAFTVPPQCEWAFENN